MSNEDKVFVIDTPEGIAFFRLLVLRSGLRLEVEHGMKHSNKNIFAILKREGIIPKNTRTKRQALEILDKIIEDAKNKKNENENENENANNSES